MPPFFPLDHKRHVSLHQQLAMLALLLGLAFLVKLPSDHVEIPVNTGFSF